MPVIETPGDLDDRLRELFCSFDSSAVVATYAASGRRTPLTRGRAMAWAAAVVAVLVVALISIHLVQSPAVKTPTVPPPSKAPVTGACNESQLATAVVFNQPGTELGAIRLTNTGSRPCSLSGRPQIVVYDGAGDNLGLEESAYKQAPDLPAPTSPIQLGSSGSSSQAIVDLDWCGFTTTSGHIDIQFAGWTKPLVEQDSSIRPLGFSPPGCPDPSHTLFAVDYVRGLKNGAVVSTLPSVTVTPADSLHADEPVKLTVHGLDPYATFFVSECASAADLSSNPSGCGIRQPFKWTDGSGTDSITFDVDIMASRSGITSASVTCTDHCVVVASTGTGSGATSAFAPIRFAPPVVSHTPACMFSQLAVTSGSPGVGLGHVGVVLLFKNTGTEACSLFGYPGVAGLNAEGVQVTQAERTLNGYLGGAGQIASEVVIAPGESASAIVEGTDNPVGNATSCPTYSRLLVTPPNTTRSVTIDISLPGCSGLQVHPVVTGTTGSVPDF